MMANKSINNNFTKSNIIDFNSYIRTYDKVNDFVDKYNPDIPVYCFRPELVKNSVSFFGIILILLIINLGFYIQLKVTQMIIC